MSRTNSAITGPRQARRGYAGATWQGVGEAARARESQDAASDGVIPATDRELALFGRRAIGFLIDWVLLVLVLGVVQAVVDPNAGSSGATLEFDMQLLRDSALQFAWFWPWNALGWSPGKRAVGIEMVTADGSAPGAWRGLVRTAVSFASGFALGIGYFWARWDPNRQTWHDRAAGTFVVVASERESRRTHHS